MVERWAHTSALRTFALLALVLVVVLLTGTGCVGNGSTSTPQGTGIDLEVCQLTSLSVPNAVEARCGTLTVPENRDDPTGRQIALRVAVVPAVSRSPEPDPLFVLAGGPGQSATEIYPAMAPAFGRIHQERDVVLVDQRGTGGSNPLECPLPDGDEVLSDEEVVALLSACPDGLDADLRYYTTAIAMRDLDQVRAALGYERINIYGASYGTRAALTYLRMFPDRVRSLILDAVVSPDFVLFLDAPQDGTRALELLFERCRADVACREAFPDLQAEFEALLADLDAGPLEVTMADPVSGELLTFELDRDRFTSMVFNLLYAPELVSLLPLDIHTAYARRDFAPLVTQAGATDAGLYRGMFYAVACTEDAPLIDAQEAEDLSQQGYFGNLAEDFLAICSAWPRGELPPDFRDPLVSEVPVLLLSGEADPVTPPRYAEQVAALLPNSLHLVAPGMGHGIAARGCLPRVVADFVAAGSIAGLDVACVERIEPPPFFVDFTGPRPAEIERD